MASRKVEELVARLATKWNTKCQEYLDRGAAPVVGHPASAAGMRDAGRETVACVMVHFEDDLKKNLGGGEFAKVQQNWRTGVLGSKLMLGVVATRPVGRPTLCDSCRLAGCAHARRGLLLG